MSAANIESISRLSPLQEGILYHCLHDPAGVAYCVQYGCLLDDLNVEYFTDAWRQVIARHTALRTLATWEKRDKPLQIVRAQVALPLTEEDWSDADDAEKLRRWQSFSLRDRELGFALDKAPLYRLALFRLGDDRYRFCWSFHHLMLDGWSMQIVLDEVASVYAALSRAEQPTLEPARPFADFIEWLEGQDLHAAEGYWRDALAGFEAPIRLAGHGQSVQSRHAFYKHVLSESCTSGLRQRARAEKLTINTMVIGGWSLVLAQHGRSDDVVVGTTLSGRTIGLAGIERMAGLFINTLPLRVKVMQEQRLGDWLRAIQDSQVAQRPYEQTPLTMVQRWSDLQPGVGLFDSIIAFKNRALVEGSARDEQALVRREESLIDSSHYPLAVLVLEEACLELWMIYDTSVYSETDVQHWAEQLEAILAAFADDVERPLAQVLRLSAAQRETVVSTFNQTDRDLGAARCIHELFESEVESRPDSIAVTDGETSLSYSALDERANALAVWLASRGVKRDSPVPVIAHRNVSAIVAMLAALKAGGVYVPMDPGWPAERIDEILTRLDAVAPLGAVLCDAAVMPALGRFSPIAEPLDTSAALPRAAPLVKRAAPDQLAYCIFTSGSTGRPKGVMVTHASAYNSTMARGHLYSCEPGTFALLSPLATDSSLAGMLWTLCKGGTLLLAAHRAEHDPAALSAYLNRHAATHMLCLPSLYATLLEFGHSEELGCLRTVIVAGEACTSDVIERHRETLPATQLYNEYGPSEACVWATAARLDEGTASEGPIVSIGQPIANTRVYVVDDFLRPVPVGVAGELLIAGANLARGYFANDELTAERFPSLSIADQPAQRVYRTGDLVRWRTDGSLEFLGRVDHQVKIRGYRIELEEIEAVLATCAAVKECAVSLATQVVSADEVTSVEDMLAELPASAANDLLSEIEGMSEAELDVALRRAPSPVETRS